MYGYTITIINSFEFIMSYLCNIIFVSKKNILYNN